MKRLIFTFLLILAGTACRDKAAKIRTDVGRDSVPAVNEPGGTAPKSPRQGCPDCPDLAKVKRCPAEDVARTGAKPFEVALRTPQLLQFPCAGCHAQIPAPRADGSARNLNHTDITLNHAPAASMECRTCHNPDDANTLRLLSGEKVSFDAAYRVCSQCHFQQHRDWANGAHGKRLYQWQGERVVLSCTGCHNPHSPLFPKLYPKARPTIPSTRPGLGELPHELPEAGAKNSHGAH